MAGYDWGERQRTFHMVGGKLDMGTFDFSSGSTTADVPTTCSHVMFGMAQADLTVTTSAQQTMFATRIGEVTNCTVTFQRLGGFDNEDARMNYVIAGY